MSVSGGWLEFVLSCGCVNWVRYVAMYLPHTETLVLAGTLTWGTLNSTALGELKEKVLHLFVWVLLL